MKKIGELMGRPIYEAPEGSLPEVDIILLPCSIPVEVDCRDGVVVMKAKDETQEAILKAALLRIEGDECES